MRIGDGGKLELREETLVIKISKRQDEWFSARPTFWIDATWEINEDIEICRQQNIFLKRFPVKEDCVWTRESDVSCSGKESFSWSGNKRKLYAPVLHL